MPAQLIDGKKLAETMQAQIAQEAARLRRERGFVPGLAVVLVGDNEASKVYVRNKETACQKAGMYAEQINLPASIPQDELLTLIGRLNRDAKIHGILVQLPLPKQIDTQKVLEAIAPEKDADGFHPVNMGNLLIGRHSVVPCTPLGCMKMLESIGADVAGKDAIVVGRSNIVGKPVAILLMQRHATVTIAHSKTKELPEKVRRADIVVAAIGQANFIKGDWIKEGAIVLDVGMNRGPDGKLCGDVEFAKARERAAWITPVPGGVGPMTITMLLWNTLQAAKEAAKP
ncbi:MAG TPA: bifunctional methylenetetrahydrofolate dehydrogenase/methenyltetrahydrofolate cyclohydrolase FolD [bacterium]|nr:bifunctional methylenetetrahydrofolate dehydrogenase/methenyltetrahydrofolate cyclohydrolase FolD [bacterium]